jgi:hypothetical protein
MGAPGRGLTLDHGSVRLSAQQAKWRRMAQRFDYIIRSFGSFAPAILNPAGLFLYGLKLCVFAPLREISACVFERLDL